MSISREAVEAAAEVWRIGNRHGPDVERKQAIAEYLEGRFLALRPAPSQSDEIGARQLYCNLANMVAHGCSDQEAEDAIIAAFAAVRAEATAELEALNEFGKHQNWSLEYVAKVYADDIKPDIDHWAVIEVSGPINDREWAEIGAGETEIGAGETPSAAIAAALRTRKP